MTQEKLVSRAKKKPAGEADYKNQVVISSSIASVAAFSLALPVSGRWFSE